MTTIKIDSSDLVALRDRLANMGNDQIPFATALALTRTAMAARAAVQQEMTRVFDRPTPWTISSMLYKGATKTDLTADVRFGDAASKSIPMSHALAHQVAGGNRAFKRMEGLLMRIGLMVEGENAVPGAAADLDAYGNMSRGQIVQILSWFQAFPESGYKANSTEKTRAKAGRGTKSALPYRYFFRRDAPGRGIYLSQRSFGRWSMQPVLMFVRRASYQKRLDLSGIVARTVESQFRSWFADAWQQAQASAK